MPQFKLPVIYARLEPTTDSLTIQLYVQWDEFPLPVERDVALYKDKDATQPAGRFSWHRESRPKKSTKTLILNSVNRRIEWLPPLKSKDKQNAAIAARRKFCQNAPHEQDNLKALRQAVSVLNQEHGVAQNQLGEIFIETCPDEAMNRWCQIKQRRRYQYRAGETVDKIKVLCVDSAGGCFSYLKYRHYEINGGKNLSVFTMPTSSLH